MGTASSYMVATYTSPDKFEIAVTTQTVTATGFAVTADATTLDMIEIKDAFLANWTYVKNGSNVLIFYTTDGSARTIGTGDTEEYIGFSNEAFAGAAGATHDVYWSLSDTIGNGGIDLDAATASTVFDTSSNSFLLTNVNSAGSGDPRISPYINPYRAALILPVNTKIYNYFSYFSPDETVIINAKMWSLSGDKIVFAEELYRDLTIKNGQLKTFAKENIYKTAIDNIINYPLNENEITKNDVSFVKELTIIHKTKFTIPIVVTIDMETLEVITSIEHPNFNISDKQVYLTPQYKPQSTEIKFRRDTTDSYIRRVTLKTQKFANININLIRDTNRLNHRNSISILLGKNKQRDSILKNNVGGCLMHYDKIYTVPSLTTTDFSQFYKEPIPELLSDYNNRNKDYLKQRRFQIRDMVRSHDFSLLEPS